MRNVYVYCEGQTEEAFVVSVLQPYFIQQDIVVQPIICTTSRKHGKAFKGGVTTYQRIRHDLSRICLQHRNEKVTTLFDLYGLPQDTPGLNNGDVDLYKKAEFIENEIGKDMGLPNLQFHLALHEFEALLFSDPSAFSGVTDEKTVESLVDIRNAFPNPEYINNSVSTAPSKRILQLIPYYSKVSHGSMLAKEIGIEVMRRECPHFDKWIQDISNFT